MEIAPRGGLSSPSAWETPAPPKFGGETDLVCALPPVGREHAVTHSGDVQTAWLSRFFPLHQTSFSCRNILQSTLTYLNR